MDINKSDILKKPRSVFIISDEKGMIKPAILKVLNTHFKAEKDVFVFSFNSDLKEFDEISLIIRESLVSVLIINDFIGPLERLKELIGLINAEGALIYNSDNINLKDLKAERPFTKYTFGFDEKSDFKASDLNLNGGINFKINFKQNFVPFWIEKKADEKEEILAALAATSLGMFFGLHLIEISQALK